MDDSAEAPFPDAADDSTEDADETGGTSRKTRMFVALAAAAVATLLALMVIPKVRSKVVDSGTTAQNPVPKSSSGSVSLPDNVDTLRHLAEQGDSAAQFDLGLRYADGDHVKQDYGEAAHWFELAADRGEVKAQSILAGYYWHGMGVPEDLSKAYFWAILAQANGDEAATTRASELATRFSYSERNSIRQQADEWLRNHGSNPVSSN